MNERKYLQDMKAISNLGAWVTGIREVLESIIKVQKESSQQSFAILRDGMTILKILAEKTDSAEEMAEIRKDAVRLSEMAAEQSKEDRKVAHGWLRIAGGVCVVAIGVGLVLALRNPRIGGPMIATGGKLLLH